MKKLSFWALLAPIALTIHVLSPYATAQEPAALNGLVINMSTNREAPAGLKVTLHVFTPNGGVETRTTVTGTNGEFSFGNVSFGGEERFSISTTYQDITYGVEPESLQSSTMLAIFDTTNDLTSLNINSHILIIREVDPKERMVSAAEVVLISNADLRTFKPVLQPASAMNFLRFTVPPQTSGLQVQSDLRGGDIIDVGTGFGLTAAVPPGSHQVTFNYTFPYQGNESSFSPTFLQGADIFRVLVPEGLGEATGPGLSEIQPTTIGETSYRVWSSQNLSPKTTLSIDLVNLPQPSLWEGLSKSLVDNRILLIGIPSILGLALTAVILYALRHRGGPAITPPQEKPAQTLIAEIAQLDNLFHGNKLDETEYRSKRAELKKRLLQALEYEDIRPKEETP